MNGSATVIEPRIQLSDATVVLFDAQRTDRVPEAWFDGAHWRERGAVVGEALGRGSVLLVENGAETWALRHYLRGGLVSRFIEDHYLWLGLDNTRAFREWRLLADLFRLGLPVPRPIAARVTRQGLSYRSDLITVFLPDTRPLAALLNEGNVPRSCWPRIGQMLSRFHAHGVSHPDLTAHNILIDGEGRAYLVDFDNCRRRPPGRWQERGLARLQRSLRKVALETGTVFDEQTWRLLEAGYRSEHDAPP
jgi:3-deoxy-D-manno-octulosonic acid kinase